MNPLPTFPRPLPWPTPPAGELHLPQVMGLHRQVLVTRSPRSILRFTAGVVRLMGLDKCIMTCALLLHRAFSLPRNLLRFTY